MPWPLPLLRHLHLRVRGYGEDEPVVAQVVGEPGLEGESRGPAALDQLAGELVLPGAAPHEYDQCLFLEGYLLLDLVAVVVVDEQRRLPQFLGRLDLDRLRTVAGFLVIELDALDRERPHVRRVVARERGTREQNRRHRTHHVFHLAPFGFEREGRPPHPSDERTAAADGPRYIMVTTSAAGTARSWRFPFLPVGDRLRGLLLVPLPERLSGGTAEGGGGIPD